MSDLHTDSDQKAVAGGKPLHVLTYDAWRIAWRFLWPTLPGLVIFSLAVFYQFQDEPSATVIFVQGAGIVLLTGTLYITYDMLMLDGFYLYGDRVVKRYKTGKEKSVPLINATVSITSTDMIGQMIFTSENRAKFLRSFIMDVYIDTKLARPADVTAFKEAVADISGQEMRDLERRYFAAKLMKIKKR